MQPRACCTSNVNLSGGLDGWWLNLKDWIAVVLLANFTPAPRKIQRVSSGLACRGKTDGPRTLLLQPSHGVIQQRGADTAPLKLRKDKQCEDIALGSARHREADHCAAFYGTPSARLPGSEHLKNRLSGDSQSCQFSFRLVVLCDRCADPKELRDVGRCCDAKIHRIRSAA